jgi:hypothetical protein
MSKLGFSGSWANNNVKINIRLDLISFEEDGTNIIYCPALDLSGYGNTESESKESFNIALDEFFSYTRNKGTFDSELKRMGWTFKRRKRKPVTAPNLAYLLSENEHFNDIFNKHDFKKFNTNVEMPQPLALA